MTSMTPPAERLIRPKDKELMYVLQQKIEYGHDHPSVPVLDIYKHEPSELYQFGVNTDDREWCFICPRQGNKRLTIEGYWKSTGQPRKIVNEQGEIGTKRILVFLQGRTPNGVSTGWTMHEYSATLNSSSNHQGTLVLCRIFGKSNAGGTIIPGYKSNELGSNMVASAANLMPSCSSSDYGGTSNQFMSGENQARDYPIQQQFQDIEFEKDDVELPPFPESVDYWNDQKYIMDYESEIWQMQPQQYIDDRFGNIQFFPEPGTYIQQKLKMIIQG